MEGTIAEIRMFAGNFAPRNWAFCNGQILAISTNTALFSLLGTNYGGNGTTTFALPDLRGRTPVGTGQGAGLSNINLAQVAGTPTVTLLLNNLPAHTHVLSGTFTQYGNAERAGTQASPASNYMSIPSGISAYSTTSDSQMGPMSNNLSMGIAGSSQPFNNMEPYLGMNFIICLFGIFPSRN